MPAAPTTSVPAQPQPGVPVGLPPAPAQPAGVQPSALQPTALRPRPAAKAAAAPPSKKLKPGDLVCGQCGEGNEPVRKFCSRCGQSLATATVASTPWYRRILPHRKAKVLAAGERPGRRGPRSGVNFGAIVRFVRNVVLVLIVVGGIVYAAVPGVRDAVNQRVNSVINSVTGTVAAPTPVHATTVKASGASAGHGGALAVDAFSNTYWSAPLNTEPHPTLTVGFASGTNVTVMLFISGDADNYLAEPRPKELHLVFSNGATQNITLADEAKSQQFDIKGASGITGMTIQIMSVYPSTTGDAVSVSDIEFFGKG
jgi:hypothetical protein